MLAQEVRIGNEPPQLAADLEAAAARGRASQIPETQPRPAVPAGKRYLEHSVDVTLRQVDLLSLTKFLSKVETGRRLIVVSQHEHQARLRRGREAERVADRDGLGAGGRDARKKEARRSGTGSGHEPRSASAPSGASLGMGAFGAGGVRDRRSCWRSPTTGSRTSWSPGGRAPEPRHGGGLDRPDVRHRRGARRTSLVRTRPEPGKKASVIAIDEARVSVSPLAQLQGELAYTAWSLDTLGGQIDVDVSAEQGAAARPRCSTREICDGRAAGVKEAINLPLGGLAGSRPRPRGARTTATARRNGSARAGSGRAAARRRQGEAEDRGQPAAVRGHQLAPDAPGRLHGQGRRSTRAWASCRAWAPVRPTARCASRARSAWPIRWATRTSTST